MRIDVLRDRRSETVVRLEAISNAKKSSILYNQKMIMIFLVATLSLSQTFPCGRLKVSQKKENLEMVLSCHTISNAEKQCRITFGIIFNKIDFFTCYHILSYYMTTEVVVHPP